MNHSGITPILGSDVQEVLYNFTQYAFVGGAIKKESFDLKHFPHVLNFLKRGNITQYDVAMQPPGAQRVLYELLTQYILFVTMNTNLLFPPDFLANSSAKTLGAEITTYMAEHKWPFPQLLPQ
jgi:hypothetical protein